MIIESGTLTRGQMAGEVCIVTGAGRGIGLETARALAWLGAKVVIAEIDRDTGREAEAALRQEFGDDAALFVPTDVSSEESVRELKTEVEKKYGRVDAVINNATAFRMGAVTDVSIDGWDLAYRVNVRGPVLLAQAFLPGMVSKDHGCFLCVSSSGAAPYMGAYEVFKTAQVELARVLEAEMEGKNVHALTIGPGMVRTPGSEEGIAVLAPLYRKSVEEVYAMSRDVSLTAEEAGAGFAAAVALAERFRGQEISSFAALRAIGIDIGRKAKVTGELTEAQWSAAEELAGRALSDLEEQYRSWKDMAVFKRQWIQRDFKKGAGMPAEQWLDSFRALSTAIAERDASRIGSLSLPLDNLIAQYIHMMEMLSEYEKDPAKLSVGKKAIERWIDDAEALRDVLSPLRSG
jgi:NAD(P)-dependent dehydrogenase (short-subunit alcohol dehydrogenase family)